jgi:hypothetical protein
MVLCDILFIFFMGYSIYLAYKGLKGCVWGRGYSSHAYIYLYLMALVRLCFLKIKQGAPLKC